MNHEVHEEHEGFMQKLFVAFVFFVVQKRNKRLA